MHDAAWTVGGVLAAVVLALLAWPARRLPGPWRTPALLGLVGCVFALPVVCRPESVLCRGLVATQCPVLGVKVYHLAVESAWWRERRWRAWAAYLAHPFQLVPRLHAGLPAPDRAAGRRLLARGAAEVLLGAGLLWWAFGVEWGPGTFWMEHAVKALGVYLAVIDGLFVLAAGVLRSAGMRTLDLSRHPIAAVTPADYWRRHNCEAGRFFREDVYRVLGGARRPVLGAAGAFLVSGLLHEYMASVMVGRVQGYQSAFFVVQGAAAIATWRVRPRGVARWGWRAGTILFMLVTGVLFFESADGFMRWYAHGGLRP